MVLEPYEGWGLSVTVYRGQPRGLQRGRTARRGPFLPARPICDSVSVAGLPTGFRALAAFVGLARRAATPQSFSKNTIRIRGELEPRFEQLDSLHNDRSNISKGLLKYSDNIVMNTIKNLDMTVPAAPVSAQPGAAPARHPPQAVPAIGNGAASDVIRQHAERRAEAEAAEAERKRKTAKPEPTHNFDREVGRVGDSFQVFVDLVSPAVKSHRFRIFGPPDNPAPPPPVPTADPASAHAAYAGETPRPPAVKTDV